MSDDPEVGNIIDDKPLVGVTLRHLSFSSGGVAIVVETRIGEVVEVFPDPSDALAKLSWFKGERGHNFGPADIALYNGLVGMLERAIQTCDEMFAIAHGSRKKMN